MVEADLVHEAGFADGLEDAEGAEAVDVAGVFGDIIRDADMGLGAKIVDLVGLEIVEEFHHLHGVGQVTVMQEKAGLVEMGVLIDVIDAGGIEGRGAANDAVDLVTLGKKEFCEVGTVLSGDASNKSFFHDEQ